MPHSSAFLQGLPSLLIALLDRGSPQLLVLATTFLRKLSLFADNSRQLWESGLVGQLVALVAAAGRGEGSGRCEGRYGSSHPVLSSVLRLLHNLAFDEGMRQQMVAAGLIARLAGLLRLASTEDNDVGAGISRGSVGGHGHGQGQGPPLQQLVLGLLYHLSLQDKHRSMFLYTGGCQLT
jgi:hypothetical protein